MRWIFAGSSGSRPLVVLEQDDRLVRGFARQTDRIRSCRLRFGGRRIRIRIVEQAGLEFQREYPADRLIDERPRHAPSRTSSGSCA